MAAIGRSAQSFILSFVPPDSLRHLNGAVAKLVAGANISPGYYTADDAFSFPSSDRNASPACAEVAAYTVPEVVAALP